MTLLIDSSVWIDAHQGRSTAATQFVDHRGEQEEIATTGIIFQEVLQGIRSETEYERMRRVLWSALILEPRELSTYEIAAQLYRRAREAGLTIRKPNDCLIAALALEHGALLVHNDRDFLALAQVEPSLLVYPGRAH
jgi:predicted nucleic acid-binding protein